MDPVAALKHISMLIRAAEMIDDAATLRRLLVEIKSIADQALPERD